MARESNHDRFSRELCEGLLPHFGPGYSHQCGRGHSLVKTTAFGSQRCGVILSGPQPWKRLDFALGVRQLKFHEVVLRLGLEESFPPELDHFWSTSFNCIRRLVPGTEAEMGHWSIDLRRPGGDYVPTVLPALLDVALAFFNAFGSLRAARDALLRHDGTLFSGQTWQKLAIADLALGDYAHLRQFAAAEMRGWGLERDEVLWLHIRQEFPEVIATATV